MVYTMWYTIYVILHVWYTLYVIYSGIWIRYIPYHVWYMTYYIPSMRYIMIYSMWYTSPIYILVFTMWYTSYVISHMLYTIRCDIPWYIPGCIDVWYTIYNCDIPCWYIPWYIPYMASHKKFKTHLHILGIEPTTPGLPGQRIAV